MNQRPKSIQHLIGLETFDNVQVGRGKFMRGPVLG